MGSTDEEAVDQATPPTDVGEDNGPEPDTDTVISGGNYMDHMSGSAEDDLVYLDAGDDFYDGKQSKAKQMRVMTLSMAKKEMTQSATAEGTIFCMVKRDGMS